MNRAVLPGKMSEMGSAEKYMEFYRRKSGREMAERELDFIDGMLGGCKKILSVGCGPAVIEGEMKRLHPDADVAGIDISPEMLKHAPESVHAVIGDARNMGFRDETFDCVLYLTSLEFIPDCEKALEETHRVLKHGGKVLVMMLNPESRYFSGKYGNEDSYIRKNIKHRDIGSMRKCITKYFDIKSEGYFLGIKDGDIVESNDPEVASLYVLEGMKNGE